MPGRGPGLQLLLLSTSLGGPTRHPVARGSLDPPGEPPPPILQQRLRHTPALTRRSCPCVANLKAGNECPGASSLKPLPPRLTPGSASPDSQAGSIAPARGFRPRSVSGGAWVSRCGTCLWFPAVWPWTSVCTSLGFRSLSHRNQRHPMGRGVTLNQMRQVTAHAAPAQPGGSEHELRSQACQGLDPSSVSLWASDCLSPNLKCLLFRRRIMTVLSDNS